MFIPDPDFYPSRIPDPKTATKEKGEKFLLSFLFLQPQISHISEKRTRKIVNKKHTDGAHSLNPDPVSQ